MRRLVVLIAVAGLALSLGACGASTSETQTPSSSPLTVGQYRTRVTSLCRAAADDAQTLGARGANASSLAAYFDKAAALERHRQTQFVALVPPQRFKADHSELVQLRAETISALEASATAFRNGGDLATVYKQLSARLTPALKRSNEIVTRLRLPKCGAQLGTSTGGGSAPA